MFFLCPFSVSVSRSLTLSASDTSLSLSHTHTHTEQRHGKVKSEFYLTHTGLRQHILCLNTQHLLCDKTDSFCWRKCIHSLTHSLTTPHAKVAHEASTKILHQHLPAPLHSTLPHKEPCSFISLNGDDHQVSLALSLWKSSPWHTLQWSAGSLSVIMFQPSPSPFHDRWHGSDFDWVDARPRKSLAPPLTPPPDSF